MRHIITAVTVVLLGLFLVPAFSPTFAAETIPPIVESMQPRGSDTIAWSAGKYTTKNRAGDARIARGIEVKSTSTGGNIKLRLINDTDSRGRKVYLTYPIPASAGGTQRIGFFFDEVDSAGTTITASDIIVWY